MGLVQLDRFFQVDSETHIVFFIIALEKVELSYVESRWGGCLVSLGGLFNYLGGYLECL